MFIFSTTSCTCEVAPAMIIYTILANNVYNANMNLTALLFFRNVVGWLQLMLKEPIKLLHR